MINETNADGINHAGKILNVWTFNINANNIIPSQIYGIIPLNLFLPLSCVAAGASPRSTI